MADFLPMERKNSMDKTLYWVNRLTKAIENLQNVGEKVINPQFTSLDLIMEFTQELEQKYTNLCRIKEDLEKISYAEVIILRFGIYMWCEIVKDCLGVYSGIDPDTKKTLLVFTVNDILRIERDFDWSIYLL